MPEPEAATALLLHGEESFLVEEEARRVLGDWSRALVSDFGLDTIEASRLSPATLQDALLQAPFLDPYRVVVVRWIAPARAEGLARALEQVPETTRLLMTVNGRLGPGNRLAKQVGALPAGRVVEFARMRDRALNDWAAGRARGLGLPPAIGVQVARASPRDLGVIDSELCKLAAYKAAGGSLSADDLRQLLVGGREEELFRLSDHLLPHPTAAAWQMARGLLQAGTSPTTIAYRLARHLSLVLEVKACQERGESLNTIQGHLKEHPFVVQKAFQSAARVDPLDLERGLRALLDYEWEVKSGQIDAEMGLETVLAKL